MRRLFLIVSVFSALALSASADIRLPILPAPAPPPPALVTRLVADQLYVIDSDEACILLISPRGLVKVTTEEGPIKIRGRFVDGKGQVETRTYKGKFVYVLEAAGKGGVAVFVVPTGAKSEADVKSQDLDVDVGGPPGPGPGPGPTPDAFGKAVLDAYALETDPQKLAYVQSLAALYRQAVFVADDKTIINYGQLFNVLHTASLKLLPVTALPKVRAVIGAEMDLILGTEPARPINPGVTKVMFQKAADALGLIK